MKKEHKYFGTIFIIFLLSIATLGMLFRKYALLTFQHFIETCQQLATTFFSSGTHFIGLVLVILTALVAVIFCAKTLFSLVKAQRKIKNLLFYKSNSIPSKLQNILEKVGLKEDKVVVIKRQSSHAFSFGTRSQIIVLSDGLINKLTSRQLEAVVLHEKYHLESKHSLLLILSEIISSTLFFLPLVKEINKKMKIVFEKQADAFAISIQGNDFHLTKALLKVPNSRIYFYPSFAQRSNYKLSRASVFSSIVISALAILLFLFPTQSHANELALQQKGDECTQSQCTTHCPTDSMSQEPVISSNLQHNISFISY